MVIRLPLLIPYSSILIAFMLIMSIYAFVMGYFRLRRKIILFPNEYIVYMWIRIFKGKFEAEKRMSQFMGPQRDTYHRVMSISSFMAAVFLLLEALRQLTH